MKHFNELRHVIHDFVFFFLTVCLSFIVKKLFCKFDPKSSYISSKHGVRRGGGTTKVNYFLFFGDKAQSCIKLYYSTKKY